MSSSKKQMFMNRPSIVNLSPQEKEKRWKQHLQSKSTKVKSTPKKKNRAGIPKPPSNKTASVSDCSLHYGLALSDPWSVPEPPCIPDNITLESYKFSVRCRGTAQVGTNGTGFVAINPFNPYAYSLNNTVSGFYTDSNYALNGIYNPNAAAGTVAMLTDATQPYTNATNYEQAYRVVGAGIKVCYAGNEMNRQGMWTLIRDPSNSPIGQNSVISQLLNFREVTTVPVDKEWHCCVYKPATASDTTYAPRGLDIDGTAGSSYLFYSNPCMAIVITGGTPGASFQFDTVVWFEMTGRQLPSLTVSHTDPIGFAAMSAAVSSHQPEHSPAENAMAFGKAVDQHIQSFSFIDSIASVAKSMTPLLQAAGPIVSALI